MLSTKILLLFWFLIIATIITRYIITKPPTLEGSEFIQAEVEVTTFPSLKDGRQILKAQIKNTKGYKEIKEGQNIQIMTSLYKEYKRGDILSIEGKINNSGFIFYPKIYKTAEQTNVFIKYIDKLRSIVETSIQKYLPEPHATLAIGMLLGTNKSLPTEIDQSFKKTSTTHMIVVSGFNITLVTLLVMNLAGTIHRKIAIILAMTATGIFVILAGANPPAVRAGIMAGITLTGQLLGRQVETVYALLIAAATMLLINPQLIHSLSFQLSFTATLGITALPSYIERAGRSMLEKFSSTVNKKGDSNKIETHSETEQSLLNRAMRYLSSELAATLGAQIAVTPLLTKTFGTLSLIGPFANILVSWAVPIIMMLALCVGLAGLFSELLGHMLSFVLLIFTAYFLKITEWLAAVPFANLENIKIGWVVIGVYYSIIGLLIIKYTEHKK